MVVFGVLTPVYTHLLDTLNSTFMILRTCSGGISTFSSLTTLDMRRLLL